MMNSGEKNPWDDSNDNESPAQSPLSRSKKSGGLHDASPEEEEQSPEFIAYLTSPQRAFHLERQTQTLDERRQLKVQRNQEALHRLFIHYDSNGIPLDASKERVGVSNTASFPTRQSFHPQVDTVLPKKPQAPLKDQLEKLQEKFPFRSNQIQLLFHLLHSITLQQQIQQQKEDLFIPPPPIFCFGSGGTGKTAVVKEVVKLLATFSDLVTIIPAYVDCGLLGNESYATSTLDSSAGTNKSQVLQSAWKDILYEVFYSVLETQSSEQANTITDNLDAAIVVVEEEESEGEIQDEESIYNDENRIEDERKGLRRKETTDTNSITCKSKKVLPDKTMQSGIQVCSSDGPIHNEAIGRSSADKMYKGRSAALQRGPMKGNGLPPLLQLPLLTSNLSKYTTGLPGVFAKSLDHICGPSSGRKNHVVLVLDRAECLLGLMSWFSQSERNSMLSQILFLPQHYKLNLCVIVISSHGLLQYTRIHNTQEPTEFIGTLSEMINPIRVYFENYKGPDMFETILRTPTVKSLIICGPSDTSSNLVDTAVHDLAYKAMINALVSSILSATRDLREMIRLCRILWPVALKVLHGNDLTSCPSWKESFHVDLRVHIKRLIVHCLCQPGKNLPEFDADEQINRPETAKYDTNTSREEYIRKFLLLSAFLCQQNRPGHDIALYTNRRREQGKRKRVRLSQEASSKESGDAVEMSPKFFPLERMFSVFSSIVGKYAIPEDEKKGQNYDETVHEYVSGLGSSNLFTALAELRDLGLIVANGQEATSEMSLDSNATQYFCRLPYNDACRIAESVGFPLHQYLIHDHQL